MDEHQEQWEFDIPKEDYGQTEEALRKYYYDNGSIEMHRYRLGNLNRKLDKLNNIEIRIEPEKNMGIGYSERVQTSTDGTGYAEREYIKAEDRLEKEIVDTQNEITDLKIEIANMEANISDMDEIIKPIDVICKQVLEYRYGAEKYPFEKIGMLLGIAPTTLQYWLIKALKTVKSRLKQAGRL